MHDTETPFALVEAQPWRKPRDLRGGEILFKDLLLGTEGEADNLHLSLVRTGADYITPRHRHNFDQIRVVLSGALHYGRDFAIGDGGLAYFGEGSYYGPTAGGSGAEWLLLQFGAGSLGGYLSQPQLFSAMDQMVAQGGSFAQGVYSRVTTDGRKHNQDAYEAIWEHACGRELVYPAPRFPNPVLSHPQAFAWVNGANPGVRVKPLFMLGERAVAARQVELAAGSSLVLGLPEQSVVCYVVSGAGEADGRRFDGPCAFHVVREHRATLKAQSEVTAFVFDLTRFSTAELSAARLPNQHTEETVT